MQAKHNVLIGFFFGAQYHSKISGLHGFLRVRSFGMIRIRINNPTSLRSECIKGTTKSHLEKQPKCFPQVFVGSLMGTQTVPEVSGSFDSSQFPSRF